MDLHYKARAKGGAGVKITIEGNAKEVAALVLELQGRLSGEVAIETDGGKITESVLRAIYGTHQAPAAQE